MAVALGIIGIFYGSMSCFFIIILNFSYLNDFPASNKAGTPGVAPTGSVAGRFKHSAAGNTLTDPNPDGRKICKAPGVILQLDVLNDRRWQSFHFVSLIFFSSFKAHRFTSLNARHVVRLELNGHCL